MNYTFSDRVEALKPSAIREILKLSSQPGMVPFSAGNPSSETFPATAIAEITRRLLNERPGEVLQYSVTEGYAPLKEAVKRRMRDKFACFGDDDEIIITSGAQQVMELAAKALCNEDDTVICEDPSFIGSLNAFRSYKLKLCGIPMERDGMDLDALQKALDTEKNVRFIYTIPNFQNPTGITMSLEKRKRLYEIASERGVMILEDNPYGDLRFKGRDIPAVKSLDTESIVIYAGTFSKVLSPGLRVGYCIAPKAIMSKLVVCKQVSDVHTSLLSQCIAYEFMTGYDFEGHIKKNQVTYRAKSQLMEDGIDSLLKPWISYNRVEGGLFLWCRLPDGTDVNALCRKGVERGVAVVPGGAFAVTEDADNGCIRLNYSTPTDSQIADGIAKLKSLFESELPL